MGGNQIYINDFTEFLGKAEELFKRDCVGVRSSTKTRGADDTIILKVTNDQTVSFSSHFDLIL